MACLNETTSPPEDLDAECLVVGILCLGSWTDSLLSKLRCQWQTGKLSPEKRRGSQRQNWQAADG